MNSEQLRKVNELVAEQKNVEETLITIGKNCSISVSVFENGKQTTSHLKREQVEQAYILYREHNLAELKVLGYQDE